jgi:hypothetical protein
MTKGIEILERNRQFFVLKALNFFSPRFFFFIILAEREGSTDPFFGFLNSFDRSIEVS